MNRELNKDNIGMERSGKLLEKQNIIMDDFRMGVIWANIFHENVVSSVEVGKCFLKLFKILID